MTLTRRSLILAGAALGPVFAGIAHATPAVAGPSLALPPPTGRFAVGTKAFHLIDHSRRDPLAPDTRPRELMVRLWYPTLTRRGPVAQYLSPTLSALLVAQFNALSGSNHPADLLTFPTHGHMEAAIPGTGPLVLFSPGLGTNAAFYTALQEDLASRGYIVAGIDHTFDAVVEFPDGRIEAPSSDLPFELLLEVRIGDLRSVLDRLAGRLRPTAVAAIGHSMGSMTAIGAIAADDRLRAGVALDGNPLSPASLERPFLMMGNPTHRRDTDPDWAAFYDRLRGPRLHLVIDGVGHYDLSDIAAFKAVVDLDDVFEVGPIDGARAVTITRAYAAAWLNRSLFGIPNPLLVHEPRRFPEVDFQDSMSTRASVGR